MLELPYKVGVVYGNSVVSTPLAHRRGASGLPL